MQTLSARADSLATHVGVRVLHDISIVRVTGDDRRTWLNGQISNDVRATKPGDAIYALVLGLHGKILADLFALDRGDDFTLVIPSAAADAVFAQLTKHIIMEDVELSRLDDVAVLTAQGPEARLAIERAALASASAFPCDRLGTGGFDLLVPRAEADDAFAALRTAAEELGGVAVDDDTWALTALRNGRPRFGIDFGERHYPQEAGLRERALSFGKGCYLGQEVVCTLESRGQLVRKLVQLDAAAAPSAGASITLADGTEVGVVTSAAADPSTGRAIAFAYLKRAHAVVGTAVRAGAVDATVSRGPAPDAA
jgi:folate-binding protein YgfZ